MWETSPHTPELVTRTGMENRDRRGPWLPKLGQAGKAGRGKGWGGGRGRENQEQPLGFKRREFACLCRSRAGLQRPPTWNSYTHLLWNPPSPLHLFGPTDFSVSSSLANQFLDPGLLSY